MPSACSTMSSSSPCPAGRGRLCSALLLPASLLLLCLLLLLSPTATTGNDDASPMLKSSQYFRRNAKWINLPSGGGSLVSGRGNFRPGFHSALRDPSMLMGEPLFAAVKRSAGPVRFTLLDRDFADPVLTAFARRR